MTLYDSDKTEKWRNNQLLVLGDQMATTTAPSGWVLWAWLYSGILSVVSTGKARLITSLVNQSPGWPGLERQSSTFLRATQPELFSTGCP